MWGNSGLRSKEEDYPRKKKDAALEKKNLFFRVLKQTTAINTCGGCEVVQLLPRIII